jgi:protein-glutamine gamma-glutamyltransferase
MKNSTATLCSLALCLWGYQTGAWQIAIPMVLMLEARNFVKRRWTLSKELFKFIPALAGFLWLLSIFHIPMNSPAPIPYAASHHIIKCLPVGLFPFVLTQTYSRNFTILFREFFGQFYRSKNTLNLYYPYFGVCLVAASVTGGNTALFMAITAILVAGLLGTVRSQRFSPSLFYGLIGLAVILSLIGTLQFQWLQANVTSKGSDIFNTLIQNIASTVSKNSNQRSKDTSTPDASKEAEQRTKDVIAEAFQDATQTTKGLNSNSLATDGTNSSKASQATSQQGGETSNVNTTTPSQSTSLSTSKMDDPGSSQTTSQQSENTQNVVATGVSNSTPSPTTESGASQSSSSAPSSSSDVENEAKQEGEPVSSNTVASSEGTVSPLEGNAKANGIAASQSAGQPNKKTNETLSSHALQAPNQNPSKTGSNPSGLEILQQARGDTDPQKSSTLIGKASSLKPSDTIIFKVIPNPNKGLNQLLKAPLYIREAAYNQYSLGTWNAVTPKFITQNSRSNQQHWVLGPQTLQTISVRISAYLPDSEGVLKLPVGTSEIDTLAVDSMQANQYGTVVIKSNPKEISYTVQFDPTQILDSPPTQLDLDIPQAEQQTMQKVLKSLALKEKSEQQTVQAIAAFFEKNFQYSLVLPQPQKDKTPLSSFLLGDRSGHCEYFASATSLLLRAAGIPARYVVGYSVHEYSPTEQQYIVRDRNAHAWVMAYINGSWKTVDTTPSGELPLNEKANAKPVDKSSQKGKVKPTIAHKKESIKSFPQEVLEVWSSLHTLVSKNMDTVLWASAILILGLGMILVSLFLVWKALRQKHCLQSTKRLRDKVSGFDSPPLTDGLDSEFYLIEKRLGEWGLERKASETVKQWILRLRQKLPNAKMNHLNEIIDLHYRYRFDPQGIMQDDHAQLRSMIQSWLTKTKR